jgi:hypothetical protein
LLAPPPLLGRKTGQGGEPLVATIGELAGRIFEVPRPE